MVREHADVMREAGHFEARRRAQALAWMHDLIATEVQRRFRADPAVASRLAHAEQEVSAGRMSARSAAREVLRQS
jgi:LAO/AO transport system kinase